MADEIRLIGFNLTKIEGEKKPDFDGTLSIKSNIDISNIEKHQMTIGKQDALKASFKFVIDYAELGKVALEGIVFLIVPAKMLKQATIDWKKKKIEKDLQLVILNIIVQRASLRAFQLEEELGLPIHIQLPRVAPKEEANK